MYSIYFKKTENNYLEVLFLDKTKRQNIFFDSFYFRYLNNNDTYIEKYEKLDSLEIDFEIENIRAKNDDIFFILLKTGAIIQISIIEVGHDSLSQDMYFYFPENEYYKSVYSRYISSTICKIEID